MNDTKGKFLVRYRYFYEKNEQISILELKYNEVTFKHIKQILSENDNIVILDITPLITKPSV